MSLYSLRKTDIGLMLTVLTIVGVIWAGYAKPASWDQAVKEINELKPRVKTIEEQLIEYKAINSTQMGLIIRELDGIHKELKKQ